MTQENALPIQRSIFDPAALGTMIAEAFGFQRAHCRLIKPMMTDSYQLWADNKQYFLRVYRAGARTRSQIEAELDLVDYLDDAGLLVQKPLKRKVGSGRVLRLAAPEGERFAVVFEYLEGRPMTQVLNANNARNFGQYLARVHQTLDRKTDVIDRPAITLQTLLRDSLRALKTSGLMTHRARDLAFLLHTISIISTQIVQLPEEKPIYGLCHGDVDPSNVIVMEDGRIALIDFDHCGPTYRAYDLASLAADLSFRGLANDIRDAFMAGYESARKLTDNERRLLPYFRAVRQIWSLGVYGHNVDEWGSYRLPNMIIDRMLDDVRIALDEVKASS